MAAALEDVVDRIETSCCIVGGGPAGVMLGLLLARASVPVVVLEKHADFLRDFRGDTIHPSTLEVLHELGLLEEFLRRPHQEYRKLSGLIGDEWLDVVDLGGLRARCPFLAILPQWDFLDFLSSAARSYPGFQLRMRAEVESLVEEAGRVTGVRARTPNGPLEVRASLVVGADGRHSVVRARAGLETIDLGAPIDVLWFRVPREPGDPSRPFFRVTPGRWLVLLERDTYWQVAFVIEKGGLDAMKAQGLERFRHDVDALVPWFGGRMKSVAAWDDVKLLTVRVDRLRRWYRPGLLCIGDAAHAMSPIGGVGINLAIQDAVAAANVLGPAFARGGPTEDDLARIQRRRERPTALTQRIQVLAQDRLIAPVLAAEGGASPPLPFVLLSKVPPLRRMAARFVGLGFRPEHVRT